MHIAYYRTILPSVMSLAVLVCTGCGGDTPQPPVGESSVETEDAPQVTSTDVSEPALESPVADSKTADDGPGLAIGDQAPDFQLKDQNGEVHSLSSLRVADNVALVFYRSADW